MAANHDEKKTITEQELDNLIRQAVEKVGGKKDNDICRFIPVSTGGYIHHFTMRKMKTEAPVELAAMLKRHILNSDTPMNVKPKQRAARGSRKRRDQFFFSKTDLERLLNMARISGDKEMVRKLTPKKDLKQLKRELIYTIRNNQVEQELWNQYCEAVTTAPSGVAEAASVA